MDPIPVHMMGPILDHMNDLIPDHMKEPILDNIMGLIPDHMKDPIPDHMKDPIPDHMKGPILDCHMTGLILDNMMTPDHMMGPIPDHMKEPILDNIMGLIPDHMKGPILDNMMTPDHMMGPIPDHMPNRTGVLIPDQNTEVMILGETTETANSLLGGDKQVALVSRVAVVVIRGEETEGDITMCKMKIISVSTAIN